MNSINDRTFWRTFIDQAMPLKATVDGKTYGLADWFIYCSRKKVVVIVRGIFLLSFLLCAGYPMGDDSWDGVTGDGRRN